MKHPGVPDVMRDDSVPQTSDWMTWKPIPSTVTDAELDDLERYAGLPFPPLYRDLLKYVHFFDLTERGVRFQRHLPGEWDTSLRKIYLHCRDRIMDVGLLPFGDETPMDAGPVCFDTTRFNESGDCPSVFWDHEWVGTDKEVNPLFSSTQKMFECLTFVANNDVNFFSHFDDDDPAQLPIKRELLAEFLKIDPNGAGGPGRDHWTFSGVTPAE